MRCDVPHMPEGILHSAGPILVELIRHGPLHCCPSSDSLREYCVHVLDVEKDAHRRPAKRLRTARVYLGGFVRKHDDRIAYLDFGVADLATRLRHAQQFLCTKRLLIELDCLRRTLDDQVRRRGVIAIRDRFRFVCHQSSPFALGIARCHYCAPTPFAPAPRSQYLKLGRQEKAPAGTFLIWKFSERLWCSGGRGFSPDVYVPTQ